MRKGFTLIETVIVLSIISILSISSLGFYKTFKTTNDKLILENYVYEVKSLLSYAKSYCRQNKIIGQIVIDDRGKHIKFIANSQKIRNIDIGYDFKVTDNFISSYISVGQDGFIKNAGTIRIIKDKIFKEIKIGVGSDIIGIGEGDLIE